MIELVVGIGVWALALGLGGWIASRHGTMADKVARFVTGRPLDGGDR